jgi:hypothetical protein
MVQETVIPFHIVYQAVMRKFTSDGKALLTSCYIIKGEGLRVKGERVKGER